jgi:hypothetical protein
MLGHVSACTSRNKAFLTAGSPRAGKEEDVDADKGDQCLIGSLVVWQCGADAGDDELRYGHSNSTEHQARSGVNNSDIKRRLNLQRASTPCFNEIQARNRAADIDHIGNDRDNERIRDSRILKV